MGTPDPGLKLRVSEVLEEVLEEIKGGWYSLYNPNLGDYLTARLKVELGRECFYYVSSAGAGRVDIRESIGEVTLLAGVERVTDWVECVVGERFTKVVEVEVVREYIRLSISSEIGEIKKEFVRVLGYDIRLRF
jgi:hypothetical protein